MIDNKTDTAIRAEGAELYVQALLMVERGIPASLASRNMPGYDILAHNLENGKSCRIQVKYRKATNADGMRIKNFDFDFVVYVAGRIGRVGRQDHTAYAPRPEFYVIPKSVAKKGVGARDLYASPSKGGHDKFRDAWHLIDSALGIRRAEKHPV